MGGLPTITCASVQARVLLLYCHVGVFTNTELLPTLLKYLISDGEGIPMELNYS